MQMEDDRDSTLNGRTSARSFIFGAMHTLVAACITTLVGPPLSGILVFGGMVLLSNERPDAAPGNVAGLLIASALAGYVIAGLPTFTAALALVAARQFVSPTVAAFAVGVLSVGIYFCTLGAHLLPWVFRDHQVLLTGLGGFIGTVIAARAALAGLDSRM